MKALIGGGLCLALGLMTARSFAQEIQWRPKAGAAPTVAPAQPAQANPIVQATYTVTETPAGGVGLGRPQAADASAQQPPAFRPVGIFARGKAEDPPAQLPLAGGQVTIEVGKPEPKSETLTMPPKKVDAKPEWVPHAPVIVENEPIGYGPVAGTCAYDSCQTHDSCMSSNQCCTVADNCGCAGSMRRSFRRMRPVTSSVVEDCGCVYAPTNCDCATTSCTMSDCCVDSCPTCLDNCGICEEGCPWDCRIYGNASFLLWAFRPKNLPPLVTSSSAIGILGLPTTTLLYGPGDQESKWHSGGRFNLGFWLPGNAWGLEAGFLFLGKQSSESTFASNNGVNVFRPFFLADGTPAAQGGNPTVNVNMSSRLWGAEANVRQKLVCGPQGWIDMLYGYRHLDLEEGLTITERPTIGPARLLVDSFNTRNTFDGGQIGIQGERHFLGAFFVGGSLKVALGNMHQLVDVQGATTFAGNPTITRPGALLALNSNIGTRTQDRFAVVPELNFKLGYEITQHWRMWVGYDFLFMSSVVRPGDQIDTRINAPDRLPTATRDGLLTPPAVPAPLLNPVSFWAQGASFGMEYRW